MARFFIALCATVAAALVVPRRPRRLPRVGLVRRAVEERAVDAAGRRERRRIAPLVDDLKATERASTVRTALGALGPSLGVACASYLLFGPMAHYLRGSVGAEGLSVLANDEGQYFQNYVNAINVMFSLLLVNTFAWLYGQQETLYAALFEEVSVAKALLEQIAYVSRGRPAYAGELLGHVRRYVDADLTDLDAEPAALLLGRTAGTPEADPLEAVLWLTSVGAPGDLYATVRSLREARGRRLGALQRKLPATHFGLLATLAVLVLGAFPLLGAATGAAVAADDGLLGVQATLFALMTFAVSLTLLLLYAFWRPTGSAYNVDAVLGVMVDGLSREIDERSAAVALLPGGGAGGAYDLGRPPLVSGPF